MAFVRREEVAVILEELRALRDEVNRRFDQVDQRFEQTDDKIEKLRDDMDQRFDQVDQRFEEVHGRIDTLEDKMELGFRKVYQAIDRLGARWGIRMESVFRETIVALLEESFGVKVEQRTIKGEQFDIIIYDHQHVLVEIAASVGQKDRGTSRTQASFVHRGHRDRSNADYYCHRGYPQPSRSNFAR